jgi:L-ribulose-5-phosphate 4-epimerase
MNCQAACFKANHDLVTNGLAQFTWGNASIVDRAENIVLIKPSGVAYDRLTETELVAVRLGDGSLVNKDGLRPSSDTPTHLVLYRSWPQIGGIVHTHSEYATAYSQVEMDLIAEGTTHADYFRGDIPCTRQLTLDEVNGAYEENTGHVIVEEFTRRDINPLEIPACLIRQHGPFSWGKTVEDAVHHATVLERLARMALHSRCLSQQFHRIPNFLLDRHYLRKNGPAASYGQGSALKKN